MLLVRFVVVLILPAFQGDGFLFGSRTPFHCFGFLDPIGTLLCRLDGSKHLGAKLPNTCEVTCIEPNKRLKLPERFCPGGTLRCGTDVEAKFKTYQDELENKKKGICEWGRGQQEK
uniref:Putative ixodes 10 kDa peptide protein n=1 Tax=Ixodes ricinus TaxID=34613 RepID=A0A0K8RN52_IXORI